MFLVEVPAAKDVSHVRQLFILSQTFKVMTCYMYQLSAPSLKLPSSVKDGAALALAYAA